MKDSLELYSEILVCAEINNPEKQKEVFEILNKYSINKLAGHRSFEECYAIYINAKKCDDVSNRTLMNYKSGINSFRKWIRDKVPSSITSADIRDYVLYLKNDRKLNRNSINQHITIVKCFFTWLMGEQLITENPSRHIKHLKTDVCSTRNPLSVRELNKIRTKYKNLRDKALVEFLVNTGCRVSEASNIKISDVDLDKNFARVVGKGNKPRTVFFDSSTSDVLREYAKQSNCEYLFTTIDGTKRLAVSGIESIARRLGKQASIKDGLFPHRFRHTFATNALNKGMNIIYIQQLLGHEDLSTTQIYAKANSAIVKRQYCKIFDDKDNKEKKVI